MSIDYPERFLAIDQIADLEAQIGKPIVTQALADLSNCDLVPRGQGDESKAMSALLVSVISLSGAMSAEAAQALADKEITPDEMTSLRDRVAETIAALQHLHSALKG